MSNHAQPLLLFPYELCSNIVKLHKTVHWCFMEIVLSRLIDLGEHWSHFQPSFPAFLPSFPLFSLSLFFPFFLFQRSFTLVAQTAGQ